MSGIISGIGSLFGANPGNAQAQNDLGVSEQARNDAASRYQGSTQDILNQFLQYAQGTKNPATSGQYAPMMQNPNASAKTTAPQIGSVYAGFNPGAVPPITPGSSSAPGVPANYQSVLANMQSPATAQPQQPTATAPSVARQANSIGGQNTIRPILANAGGARF